MQRHSLRCIVFWPRQVLGSADAVCAEHLTVPESSKPRWMVDGAEPVWPGMITRLPGQEVEITTLRLDPPLVVGWRWRTGRTMATMVGSKVSA